MRDVNFIPADRQRVKRVHRQMRQCAAAGVAYVLVLLGVSAGCYAAFKTDDDGTQADIERIVAEAHQTQARIGELHRELETVHSQLTASRAVGRQPDWSVLVRLVAEQLGPDVVLRTLRVEPVRPPAPRRTGPAQPPAEPQAPPTDFVLHVEGLGRTQADVSAFVLRLEQTRLFGRVRTSGTIREPFLDGMAIRFSLECTLASRGAASP